MPHDSSIVASKAILTKSHAQWFIREH